MLNMTYTFRVQAIVYGIMNTFTKAIEEAGSLSELCRRLSAIDGCPKVTPQIFQGWSRRNSVPADRVWQFSQATGIPPWEIRPDIYDRPEVYLSKVSKACSR